MLNSSLGVARSAVASTIASFAFLGVQPAVSSQAEGVSLQKTLRAQISRYLHTRRVPEHISGVSLRVTFANRRAPIAMAVGKTRYHGGASLSRSALWQVGSNTKAFTSVTLLKLEAEHKLSISDTLGKWLPQYPAWRSIKIKQLLNMTSGIQDYDQQPAFLRAFAADPHRAFSESQLVSYAVDRPLQKGWNYSNTNYILAQMTIERASHDSYTDQLRKKIITPLGLHSLFFNPTRYSSVVTSRMPAGYFFNSAVPGFARLMGKNLRDAGVSSYQGAGGIVSSLADVTKWDRALYTGRELPRTQQRQLESLVSMTTGKPIRRLTRADPLGFGLGVGQAFSPAIGRIWFYEGTTFGYRVLHIYSVRSGTELAVAANSAPKRDQLSPLGLSILQTLDAHSAG